MAKTLHELCRLDLDMGAVLCGCCTQVLPNMAFVLEFSIHNLESLFTTWTQDRDRFSL